MHSSYFSYVDCKFEVFEEQKDRNSYTCQNYLVLVNADSLSTRLVKSLWSRFMMVLCADGAANRLHDGLSEVDSNTYIPDVICGDLDSIRTDVQSFYRHVKMF